MFLTGTIVLKMVKSQHQHHEVKYKKPSLDFRDCIRVYTFSIGLFSQGTVYRP